MSGTRKYILQCPACKSGFTVVVSGSIKRMQACCSVCFRKIAIREQTGHQGTCLKSSSSTRSRSGRAKSTRSRKVPSTTTSHSAPIKITGAYAAYRKPSKRRSSRHQKVIPFGNYLLMKKLGDGCMGTVYLAEHVPSNTKCALKIIAKNMQNNAELLRRFHREAQVLSSLFHPNIVKFRSEGSHNGRMFLDMEYIEGVSLEDLLDAHRVIAPRYAIKIALAIARALEHALQRHIIHRDIKPANILIEKNTGIVKLADLGLGKILGEGEFTRTDQLMGTPNYMAPEQITDTRGVDHRADIYSLGATLYHMLSGEAPYGDFDIGLHDVLCTKIARDPTPLQKLAPNLSVGLITIVERAMERKVARRYQSPGEILEDLQRILQDFPR